MYSDFWRRLVCLEMLMDGLCWIKHVKQFIFIIGFFLKPLGFYIPQGQVESVEHFLNVGDDKIPFSWIHTYQYFMKHSLPNTSSQNITCFPSKAFKVVFDLTPACISNPSAATPLYSDHSQSFIVSWFPEAMMLSLAKSFLMLLSLCNDPSVFVFDKISFIIQGSSQTLSYLCFPFSVPTECCPSTYFWLSIVIAYMSVSSTILKALKEDKPCLSYFCIFSAK